MYIIELLRHLLCSSFTAVNRPVRPIPKQIQALCIEYTPVRSVGNDMRKVTTQAEHRIWKHGLLRSTQDLYTRNEPSFAEIFHGLETMLSACRYCFRFRDSPWSTFCEKRTVVWFLVRLSSHPTAVR